MSTRPTKDKPRLDIAEIQKLIRMIERSPITEFELVENDLKIRISKNGSHPEITMMPAQMAMPQMGYAPQQMAAMQAPLAAPTAPAAASETRAPSANTVDVKAPMVGTLYRAPSPDAEPYIRVGDMVEPGKVLCIIEAMKLMNEIECEVKGRVVEILVDNAQPVEFGQVLFRIERAG
ncbi:MAG: acetyl-CoA carboxylase biotin carboxyl carrier protein [bacterium]|nr:acetyl-CoA carboxylase biotin carboxyl carrier protein [bacterium]MBK8130415.1 acetyl-CoA carboxylase biotin carboxyl carrier protein [bacterium]